MRPTTEIRWRSPIERETAEGAARNAGLPLSTWLRRVVLERLGLPLNGEPEADASRAAASLAGRRKGGE